MGNALDAIKFVWILPYPNSVPFCNEPGEQANKDATGIMPLELFTRIANLVSEQSLNCAIIGSEDGIDKHYQLLCNKMGASVILPVGCKDCSQIEHITFVVESDKIDLAEANIFSSSRIILRLRRKDLLRLCEIIQILLNNFSDISVRHPDLLSYSNEDFIIYREQLLKTGRLLLDRKKQWQNYRIDCLTDRFRLDDVQECGAGDKSIAIGPDGKLYVCPAVATDSNKTCGDITEGLKLPNSNLFERKYSLPCSKCEALHCLRCVYLSKLSTFEVCVPSKNICQIANTELEVQAWLAQEAIKRELWNDAYNIPVPPTVYDPYEIIRTEDSVAIVHNWHSLVSFSGHPENLKPSMMLDILHGIQGWSKALLACIQAEHTPSVDLISRDILASLRQRTIERYRDVFFKEDCPTIRQLELLMCKAAEKRSDSSHSTY